MPEPDLDTRSRILDAAERAFAEGGLAGARVASIAKDAGANKAMLYYYFDSKEALYFAVLERVMGQIGAVAGAAGLDPSKHPTQAVEAFVSGYQTVLAGHPHFVRLVMRGLLDHPQAIIDFVQPRIQPFVPLVLARIGKAQEAGQISTHIEPILTPPALVAPLLLFAFAQPALARISGIPAADLTQRFRANVLEIYLNGLLPREDR